MQLNMLEAMNIYVNVVEQYWDRRKPCTTVSKG